MSKKIEHTEGNLGAIEHSLSSAELFIEKYERQLIYGGVGILLLVGVFFAYKNWYQAPREEAAQSQLFTAVQYFEQDSLNLALNGDGSNLGLIDVEDQYGSTTAGNLAAYYAGLAYLHTGQYDEAIRYFNKYSASNSLAKALVNGNLGDAYSELGSYDKAVAHYKKSADSDDNKLTAPRCLLKAGILLEKQGKFGKAKEQYERLKRDYSDTAEGREADKYIARAQVGIEQNS
ncbi:MAG: tetratricopeptide repeat protein [Prevotellaceae bacterium]|jgi:tetratricopeptide (TPR) repeat protein|nr:tetratricopeptide repeat protein [Prevotellaceae bacterium]